MINTIYFPTSEAIPQHLIKLVESFRNHQKEIDSHLVTYESNNVLELMRNSLTALGYDVEKGKKKKEKIDFPVLFGINGKVLKSFNPDAFHKDSGTILEIEAGRAVDNNEYIKDLFKAFLLPNVNYLAIAVKNEYRKKNDFEKVCIAYQAIYASQKFQIPIKGVLLIGY